jgi:hypothetical protein
VEAIIAVRTRLFIFCDRFFASSVAAGATTRSFLHSRLNGEA